MYDQLGCLSPQAIYLKQGSDLNAFCAALANTLSSRPRPRRSPLAQLQIASRVCQMRTTFSHVRTWTPQDGGTDWTIFQHRSARFQPSCGYRTIHVHEVSISHLSKALHSIRGRGSPRWAVPPQSLPWQRNNFLILASNDFAQSVNAKNPHPTGIMMERPHHWEIW